MCVGVPSEIESCDEISAMVKMVGTRREISLLFLEDSKDLKPGDWVLVHAGFAVSKMDPDYARDTLNAMLELAAGMKPQTE
jgi:hydrogenase expression/formation protein HypC